MANVAGNRDEEYAWSVSRGDCRPEAGAVIAGEVYSSLLVGKEANGVVLRGPIILGGVTIQNDSATGSLVVPIGTSAKLGGSMVRVQEAPWSWIRRHLDW